MSKHTPGPWVVRENKNNGYEREDSKFAIESNARKVDDRFVVAVTINDVEQLFSKANASLIAAAPELLKALENILRHGGTKSGEWISARYYKQAQAALAKARGGQS